jgi:hypothetical protein
MSFKWVSSVACVVFLSLVGTGCLDKAKEPFRDSPIGGRDDSPADVINMPDGFSNVATKCGSPGIRIFVAFKSNQNRAAITAVADPNC